MRFFLPVRQWTGFLRRSNGSREDFKQIFNRFLGFEEIFVAASPEHGPHLTGVSGGGQGQTPHGRSTFIRAELFDQFNGRKIGQTGIKNDNGWPVTQGGDVTFLARSHRVHQVTLPHQ